MSPDIYVQIPAYKDLELPETLRSLYDRARRPDALRVGQPIDVYLNPKTPVADKR